MAETSADQRISSAAEHLRRCVDRRRLLAIASQLIAVPSPTGQAGAVSDTLAQILVEEGFAVERPEAGHPDAPAVAVRLKGGRAGRVLQFDGHLDTVHLPFSPPKVEGDLLPSGEVLLTAHDLHEAPWGFGQQLDRLIAEGYVGDAVLLPEPLSDRLPVAGRGQMCWEVTIRRPGPPVHEVMRPADEPSVIAAGAELVARLGRLDDRLSASSDPVAGRASVFIGQIHSGEIYNQYPRECRLEGTRRWLPGTSRHDVEREFRELLDDLARDTGVIVDARCQLVRDAFALDQQAPIVGDFLRAYGAISGVTLPAGPKPFVDDGNCFWAAAGVPAITHGPRAGGQHTIEEWASIDDLVRVAHLYALTATLYCPWG
jgi:acetylornithine deacetylase/succinyl-diaminopimelate desuccinylase-like protein